MVDMVDLPVEDQSGHGLDACLFGFLKTGGVLAEVDDFQIEPDGVERVDEILFRVDTDRASGVIEDGFGFHGIL